MKRAIGYENSNSSQKGLSDSNSIDYSNTIKKLRSTSRLNKNFGEGKIFEVNGNTYLVGMKDGYGSGSKDESRYYSEEFKLESGIALSQMCNHGDKLQIITGLPANLANREDIIEKLKNNLVGPYSVKHQNAKKDFMIEKVNVVSQPVGTLWSMLFDIEGNQKVDKTLLEKDYLILDLGKGTTDLCGLSASSGISLDKTLDIAMGDYINDLHQAIENEIPQSRLTATGITPTLLDLKLVDTDILDIQTGKFNVREIKEDLQEEFALKIRQMIGGYNLSLDKYHQIILTGGGSIVMEKAIKKVFKNNRIKLINNPRLANVTGFYIMARQTYGI